jgi:hypothetical protein
MNKIVALEMGVLVFSLSAGDGYGFDRCSSDASHHPLRACEQCMYEWVHSQEKAVPLVHDHDHRTHSFQKPSLEASFLKDHSQQATGDLQKKVKMIEELRQVLSIGSALWSICK